MAWTEIFSEPETLVLMIPIVAIVVGGICAVVRLVFHHRERMAMIERGLHPDHPPEDAEPEEDPAAEPGTYERAETY